MKPYCVTTQMKAIKQHFHVVLLIMLYKVVLTCKSVNETLVWNPVFKGKLLHSTFIIWKSVFVCTHRTHIAGTVRIEAHKYLVVYSLQEQYSRCDIEN